MENGRFICVCVYTFPIFEETLFFKIFLELILNYFSNLKNCLNYLLSFSPWLTYKLTEGKRARYEKNTQNKEQRGIFIKWVKFKEAYETSLLNPAQTKTSEHTKETYSFQKCKIYSRSDKIAKQFKYK